jgi:hypothetical protein
MTEELRGKNFAKNARYFDIALQRREEEIGATDLVDQEVSVGRGSILSFAFAPSHLCSAIS